MICWATVAFVLVLVGKSSGSALGTDAGVGIGVAIGIGIDMLHVACYMLHVVYVLCIFCHDNHLSFTQRLSDSKLSGEVSTHLGKGEDTQGKVATIDT